MDCKHRRDHRDQRRSSAPHPTDAAALKENSMKKPRAKKARLTKKIKRIRLLKVEKLPGEPETILVNAELLVEGVPDPPLEPLPTEPFEFSPCSSLREAVSAAEMIEV